MVKVKSDYIDVYSFIHDNIYVDLYIKKGVHVLIRYLMGHCLLCNLAPLEITYKTGKI